MAETSDIEWTDATVNFWWGCQKVGPGCDHCYAETWDRRTGGDHWGAKAPRRKIKSAAATLRKIDKGAEGFRRIHGRWPRVFLHSMSDLFDNHVPQEWREEAFREIAAATNTRPQLVTKRIGNVGKMATAHWPDGWPRHVGLLITVVNQEEADRDIPSLLRLKSTLNIPWVGLSMEPLLGPVDLTHLNDEGIVVIDSLRGWGGVPVAHAPGGPRLDWVIAGGESGPKARPSHPDWFRSIRDQCADANVPFLFKQWGEWAPGKFECNESDPYYDGPSLWCDADDSEDEVSKYRGIVWCPETGQPLEYWTQLPDYCLDGRVVPASRRVGKKRAGRELDGVIHDGFPPVG